MPGSMNPCSHARDNTSRWRRRLTLLAVTAAMGVLSACHDPTVCPAAFFVPIQVELRDASTGAPIARGATGTIQAGDFVSPLVLPNADSELYLVAEGGSGLYDVRIQKEGYQDWERRRVMVSYLGCGQPKTVFLEVELTPTA